MKKLLLLLCLVLVCLAVVACNKGTKDTTGAPSTTVTPSGEDPAFTTSTVTTEKNGDSVVTTEQGVDTTPTTTEAPVTNPWGPLIPLVPPT